MVSVIIVNYKTGELLRKCLASLRDSVRVPYEVIVIDNASDDPALESLTEFPNLRIQIESLNHGFSKACNIGAALATGDIFHFLNPDTEVAEDINECYAMAERDATSIYVTRIYDPKTGEESAGYAFPTLRNLVFMIFAPSRVRRWYLGASVVVDRKTFLKLGGFSEDYFMYAEDVDFFYKAYLAGVPTVLSTARVIHHQGGASRQIWNLQERFDRCERSALIFAKKFGLRFDYFVFRHVAFLRLFWKHPAEATMELCSYWRAILK